jgi:hypothetical protein
MTDNWHPVSTTSTKRVDEFELAHLEASLALRDELTRAWWPVREPSAQGSGRPGASDALLVAKVRLGFLRHGVEPR